MSLRARLLVAAAAVAVLALAAADLATYASLRSFLHGQVRSSLESSHVAIERSLTGAPSPTQASPGEDSPGPGHDGHGTGAGTGSFCAATAGLAPGSFVEVRSPSGTVVSDDRCPAIEPGGERYSPSLPAAIGGFRPTGPHREPTAYFTAGSATSGGPAFEVRVSELQAGPHAGDLLVLAQPLTGADRTLGRLVLIELAVTGGGLAFAVVLGWLLVNVGMRPLRRVERTAVAIARGDLSERVPGATPRTEVGQLGLAMNTMADSIEHAFAERDATEAALRGSEERLRRFVADASHELRTPVAAMSAYAELLERADRLGEDIPRILVGIGGESRRMGRLVEDLLLLARLDEHRPVVREPVELVDLAAGAIETARTVGPDWPIRLEASGAVEVLGDHAQLRQVVDNLLGNVRAHTPKGTPATVRVAEDGGEAVLEVADEGRGLPPGVQARVFERFYRADPSRARSSGGTGLGLSIVASIAEAHGGSVAVSSSGAGSTFRIRLPRLPEEP